MTSGRRQGYALPEVECGQIAKIAKIAPITGCFVYTTDNKNYCEREGAKTMVTSTVGCWCFFIFVSKTSHSGVPWRLSFPANSLKKEKYIYIICGHSYEERRQKNIIIIIPDYFFPQSSCISAFSLPSTLPYILLHTFPGCVQATSHHVFVSQIKCFTRGCILNTRQ